MEKHITKRLQAFFDNKKILRHAIYQGMEDRKHTCAVFLDISKAFDRVWHTGLFLIERMCMNGNLNTLLNRKQKVVLNGKMSDWAYPNARVPQGFALGPLLFLIYINDINLDLDIPIYMFADDIILI